MRAVVSTVVLFAAVPICAAGAVVFLLGLGVGWLAVQVAPRRPEAIEDAFAVPLRVAR